MRPLFDHDLSRHLAKRLDDVYPGSSHVAFINLERANDDEIRGYVRSHGFTIVTKDIDFAELVVIHGFPPRVVWVRLGNCSTDEAEAIPRQYRRYIDSFGRQASQGVLALPPGRSSSSGGA